MNMFCSVVFTVLFIMWFLHIKNNMPVVVDAHPLSLEEMCQDLGELVETTAMIQNHYTFNYTCGSKRIYEGHVLLTYATHHACHYQCLMYVNESKYEHIPAKWMNAFYPLYGTLSLDCNSKECYYENLYCNNSLLIKPNSRYEF